MTRKVKLGLSVAAILLLASGGLVWHRYAPAAPRHLRLPDGTEAFFRADSRVTPAAGFPTPRDIALDGDVFFRVPIRNQPLTLRSRLLVLTVTTESAVRVTAYSKQPGEQVEVLYGKVAARKNYRSAFQEPDVLTDGQMTMVNRDIDLMEKETTHVAQLRAWSDALIAAALRKQR